MTQVLTPQGKLGNVVGERKTTEEIKVQYQTSSGFTEAWFKEADCKEAKVVAVEEKEKVQKLAKDGEEPWKKKEIKVSDKPKINKGLAGGADQYQG